MLRASRRVLAPDGRMGGYTIHTPAGLSAKEKELAVDYGPSQVVAESSPKELWLSAGFREVVTHDVTDTLLETCRAIRAGREQIEDVLRREEGDEAYEEEQEKKLKMAEGVEQGLLRRSLIIAVRD